MELRNLRTFVRVAEEHSFTKAARQMGYTQAAVTHQIKQLEEELGLQLFERIHNQTKLTMFGEQLLPLVYNVIKGTDDISSFASEGLEIRGQLRIGTCTSMMESLLPDIFAEIQERHPLIQTTVLTGTTPDSADMLSRNEVDFMMVIDEKINNPYLIRAAEREEPMDFVCGKKHPLAKKERVTMEELVEHPFVVTETGVSYTLVLEKLLAEHNLAIQPFLEIGSTNVVIDLVKRGKAIAFLPHYIVADQLADPKASSRNKGLIKLNVEGGDITLYDQVHFHKNKWITPQMQEFLDLLCEKQGFKNVTEGQAF